MAATGKASAAPGGAAEISPSLSPGAVARARRKFLRYFPGGLRDATYLAWERDYKWQAHQQWQAQLGRGRFLELLLAGRFAEIAAAAVAIESGRQLLFSFEKMALRDAVRSPAGARRFATGLYEFLHGKGAMPDRFARWCETLAALPRRQSRVLSWPVASVFGFIAQPGRHIFVKPNTMRRAAQALGFELRYSAPPGWDGYAAFLELAAATRQAIADWQPRDMIDIQSFLWVQGSDEY